MPARVISGLQFYNKRRSGERESVLISLFCFLFLSCCSVAQVVSTLCDPMDCSTPGSPVLPISWSLLKLMSIESVTPSNHLILCPLLRLPSIFPSIRVFSNESLLCIRWPNYWSFFSFSISPSNEYSGLISSRMDWLIYLQSKGVSRVFSNTTGQKHQFFSAQLSL